MPYFAMPESAHARIDFGIEPERIRHMAEAVRPQPAANPGGGPSRYHDPRAHELRAGYLRVFGGEEIPVPVESIAEDLLGLRIELSDDIDCSGVLLPAERLIFLNASEAEHDGEPIRRHRFTIGHEIGHWMCHVLGAPAGTEPKPSFCRAVDMSRDADRGLEQEANVFAAELLMPDRQVRAAWNGRSQMHTFAMRFGVSSLAMEWRLYNLGLTRDRPRPPVPSEGKR
jgi:Zn-dependent peptidase ImmA (M78 family)